MVGAVSPKHSFREWVITMSTFSEQMQAVFDRYTEEVSADPASLDEVAAWAIERGLYRPAPRDIVKICRDALADSLRQERRVDAKGRKYRAKHSVRTWIEGQQLSLWADIDTAPRSFLEKIFQPTSQVDRGRLLPNQTGRRPLQ